MEPGAQEGAMNITNEFARLAGQAAAKSNENRRAISEANIAAETATADLALKQERSKLSQAFQRHAGTVRVNAAFRGSSASDRDVESSLLSAGLRASNEAAVAEINRENLVAAIKARNAFVEEDVTLAAIEGGLRGLQIGTQIAGALQSAAEVRERQFVRVNETGNANLFSFANVFQDVAFTPGISFENLAESFQNFGLDLGT